MKIIETIAQFPIKILMKYPKRINYCERLEITELKSDSSPEEIPREILNLTISCKNQAKKIILSIIVPRYDKLNEKAMQVKRKS